jgi:hypothetical protein
VLARVLELDRHPEPGKPGSGDDDVTMDGGRVRGTPLEDRQLMVTVS